MGSGGTRSHQGRSNGYVGEGATFTPTGNLLAKPGIKLIYHLSPFGVLT